MNSKMFSISKLTSIPRIWRILVKPDALFLGRIVKVDGLWLIP